MLFEQRFWPGIADGSVTTTFRRWRRRQAVAGHRYRTPVGLIEVDAVDVVETGAVMDADARRSGYPSAAAFVADLRGSPVLPLYRVRFHRSEQPDPRAILAARAELSADERADLDRRLDRLDRASPHGPWTAAVLRAIAESPGRRAADLATAFDRGVLAFKRDVRKLKELGLTESLEIGYRLSARGAAYVRPSPP